MNPSQHQPLTFPVKQKNDRSFELILYITLFIILAIAAAQSSSNTLEKVKKRGELIVITRNGPTTYYQSSDGPAGFEYDLANAFAEHIGVKLKILTLDFNDIFPMLNGGQADLAAAGITITEKRKTLIKFGPAYQTITQQLIARYDNEHTLESIADIMGGRLEVTSGSSHEEKLLELKLQHPKLEWTPVKNYNIDELIYRVYNQDIDYTIADSNDFTLGRRYYPNLQVAFDLSEPQKLAWAFPQNTDKSLYQEALEFFDKIKQNGFLTQLQERYYGHIADFNYVDTTLFLQHIETRLPNYKATFIEAGERYKIDWRLLAAMAFQESHWRTDAISPTGVRGMMMLTLKTASQLNISNRLDSRESIMGGALYFSILKEKIPEHILEPDRSWMAIAAYNVGFGHLEDARKLTEGAGKEPNKWIDVQEILPLLSQEKWHRKTKYGYARGREPVNYVKNIRSYYEILVWLDEREKPTENTFDATTLLPQTL